MRGAEIGHHHHIAGAYLLRYAQEASWREDHRRSGNGDQLNGACWTGVAGKADCEFRGLLAATYTLTVAEKTHFHHILLNSSPKTLNLVREH